MLRSLYGRLIDFKHDIDCLLNLNGHTKTKFIDRTVGLNKWIEFEYCNKCHRSIISE